MDDVVAGGEEKKKEGKGWRKKPPPRVGPWNPSGPPAPRKGHGATLTRIVFTEGAIAVT